jgi:Tol biopolymer transport system component
MPALNAEALSVCTPLRTTDFAFTSTADGDSDIYLYQASTASIVKVTDTDAQDHWASWSQDGRMLAFQSLRDENREIYIKVFPDGDPVNSSQNAEQDLVPSWSPNNNYIVYYSSRDVPWSGEGAIGGQLYVMRVQGSMIGRIQTEPFFSPSMIAWSPDSTMLFYARFGAGKQGIYSLDLKTGEEIALLALENRYPGVASANPIEGTVDYYVEQDGAVDIYQLSLAEGFSRKLTSGEGRHYYANWSADRSALLVTSAQDAAGQLYDIRCVAADGSYDVPVIDDASDARSAVWRPKVDLEVD